MHPLKWICPLIGIEPEAFNTGGTPEFAAIKAVTQWHNMISDRLSNEQDLKPVYSAGPQGRVTAHAWCEGFMLAVDMNRRLWNDVLKTTSPHRHLMLPILVHQPIVVDGKKLILDNPSLNDDWHESIPKNAARLREIHQLKRFGKPHPNAMQA